MSLLTSIALCATIGCEAVENESTLNEANFLESFEEIFCGNFETCTLDDILCPEISSVLDTSCTYDATYATDCLSGDYTCEDGQLLVPTSCAGVYNCNATGGGTTTSGTYYPTGTPGEPGE